MLTIFLNVFRSRFKPPKLVFRFCVPIIKLVSRSRQFPLQVDFERFARSQWLQGGEFKSIKRTHSLQPVEIELVFVVTRKDFGVLKYSLPMAINSLSNYLIPTITLIVPSNDVAECTTRFVSKSNKVRVIDEDNIFDQGKREILLEKFEGRHKWVLQQLLKVEAVLTSEAEAVLIVDADTLLLRKRRWFNDLGQQLIQPSEELNPQYYSFLEQFGISRNPPAFSLVSHHMIFQPRYLREALNKLGVADMDEILQVLKAKLIIQSQSPVCVDYELYGQFMINFRRGDVFLEQWANIGISARHLEGICNSRILIGFLKFFYNSVSFHSWS